MAPTGRKGSEKDEGAHLAVGPFKIMSSPGGSSKANRSRWLAMDSILLTAMTSASSLLHDVTRLLSVPRMSTYLAATGGDRERALRLYCWNAQISAALMVPAHFAEVATRNAVHDALTELYGPDWPWSTSFHQALPSVRPGAFNPLAALQSACGTSSRTTGQVVADLNFFFWEQMFTSRHDRRLWIPRIRALFPNADAALRPWDLRRAVHDDLYRIRDLRNRVAHHEPIFTRDLAGDLETTLSLVRMRSAPTADLLGQVESVSSLLTSRP